MLEGAKRSTLAQLADWTVEADKVLVFRGACMMDGSGWGMGWVFMILVWVLIVVGVVALVRWPGIPWGERRDTPRKTPLEILQERYARGEIEREEYEQKRHDLER